MTKKRSEESQWGESPAMKGTLILASRQQREQFDLEILDFIRYWTIIKHSFNLISSHRLSDWKIFIINISITIFLMVIILIIAIITIV